MSHKSLDYQLTKHHQESKEDNEACVNVSTHFQHSRVLEISVNLKATESLLH